MHASSELLCFLHITQTMQKPQFGYSHTRTHSQKWSPASGFFFFPITNGQFMQAAELLPPCLLKASDACVVDSLLQKHDFTFPMSFLIRFVRWRRLLYFLQQDKWRYGESFSSWYMSMKIVVNESCIYVRLKESGYPDYKYFASSS